MSDPAIPRISDFTVSICTLCGDYGDHDCPGPRVSYPGGFAYEITRRLDDVHLPEVHGA